MKLADKVTDRRDAACGGAGRMGLEYICSRKDGISIGVLLDCDYGD